MFDSFVNDNSAHAPLQAAVIEDIAKEMKALGFHPPERLGHSRMSICGMSLQISVKDVACGTDLAEGIVHKLCETTVRDIPVTLLPVDFPSGVSAIDSWRKCCERIQAALMARKLSGRAIGVCMHSHRMPLKAYSVIADSLLGFGPRYVFLDNLQMANHANGRIASRTKSNWHFLWRQRNAARPVLPVYGGFVRSACRLLADEVATGVIAPDSLHAPTGTAWAVVTLPIDRFASASGQIDWHRLQDSLDRMMELGDQLLDLAVWSDTGQQKDAAANRRLIVSVTGLGDLLRNTERPPQALNSLRWLCTVVQRIRTELLVRSMRLAAESGNLPALKLTNPVNGWVEGASRDRWTHHWKIALKQAALRHRHLLALSPASIIPLVNRGSAAYVDLLPILRFADAWSFAWTVPVPDWTVNNYRDFHRRARATIQGAEAASSIADGV